MPILLDDINRIFIATNLICEAKQYGLMDTVLSSADVSSMTQDMMVAYLEATREKKDKFKSRISFYNRCKDELGKRNEKKNRKFEKLL